MNTNKWQFMILSQYLINITLSATGILVQIQMSGGKLLGVLFLTTCHDDKFCKKTYRGIYYQLCHKICHNSSSGNCQEIERNNENNNVKPRLATSQPFGKQSTEHF